MPDYIGAISRKRARLCERKREIIETAERQVAEIDAEIRRYDAAIDTMAEAIAPYLCPRCKGTGEETFTDAAGSRDYRKCPA